MKIESGLKKQTYLTCVVFVVFFVVLLVQHSVVYMYFDDYGYASLSMVNNIPDVPGTHFSFTQFLEYYRLHYLTITGRIFFQSFMTLTMAAGLWCIRIVQCVFILLTMIVIYKIIRRYSTLKPYIIAALVCCLYGSLEIFIMDKSIYWFTSSATYLWPLAPMLFGCFMYYRYAVEQEPLGKPLKVFMVICLALAATAQEQIALAELFLIAAAFMIKLFRQRRISAFDAAVAAAVITGVLFLYLSPSNAVRAEALKYEPSYAEYMTMPLLSRIPAGFKIILQYVFSKNFLLFMTALLLSGAYTGFRLIRSKRGIQLLNYFLLIVCFLCAAAMLVTGEGLYELALRYGAPGRLMYFSLGLLLALIVYGFFLYYLGKPKKFMLLMFLASGLSIFSVTVAFIPGTGRLFVPFVFMAFVPIGDIFCTMLSAVKSRQIQAAALVLLVVAVAANMSDYSYRVYKTTGRAVENDHLLCSVSERIKNGEQMETIDIKNYFNIESDALHPAEGILTVYRPGTVACIKEYYDIPQNVYFNWVN